MAKPPTASGAFLSWCDFKYGASRVPGKPQLVQNLELLTHQLMMEGYIGLLQDTLPQQLMEALEHAMDKEVEQVEQVGWCVQDA